MQIYSLEFVLNSPYATPETIRNSIAEFCPKLEISGCPQEQQAKSFKICADTENPEMVFDICAQFGRIKQVKINEEGK